jgi:energy-coupling factor transport system ATP-binding protein
VASIALEGVLVNVGDHSAPHPVLQVPKFHIASGEYVCVVGPNGAGKSMLIQVLAGIRSPGPGKVELAGGSGPGIAGLVLQHPEDQIVGSTVEKDLAFGLECTQEPPAIIREKVKEGLAWSGLHDQATRSPHLLSDGEKQLLALSSALIHRPPILLFDEPTSRLDPAARAAFHHRFQS